MTAIDAMGPASTQGLLAGLIADSRAVRRQVDKLTAQAGSGRIADTFGGLANGGATSLSLRPRIAALEGWQANIDGAAARMDVARTALDRVQAIGAELRAGLASLNGVNPGGATALAARARSMLAEVGTLLNTEVGGVYVFAGTDSANPPVPNPDGLADAPFSTAIAAAVGGLAANGAAATAAATATIAADNDPAVSPFSAWLSQDPAVLTAPRIEIGAGRTVQVGIPASANGFVSSSASSPTGSAMRDLLRSLATVAALSDASLAVPGAGALVEDTRATLTDAMTTLATDAGVLGNTQSILRDAADDLDATRIALLRQLDPAENVDMAETLSRLSQAQTQLQASYQLISGTNGLSLTKFLGGG